MRYKSIFNRKCKITFIRHGSTIYSEENRLLDGENYPPLNENGRMEMEKISNWVVEKGLKIDKIYASPALRSIQSARILSKACKQDFEIIDALKSKKAGKWSGLTFEQIETKYPEMLEQYRKDPENYWASEGETTSELNKRTAETIENIIKENIGNRLIILTHGEIIQAAIKNALEIPGKNQFKVYIPTGSATQISYYSDWASLIYSAYLPL